MTPLLLIWLHLTQSSQNTHPLLLLLHLLCMSYPTVLCGVIFQRLTWGVTLQLMAADCSCELRFGGESKITGCWEWQPAEAQQIPFPPEPIFGYGALLSGVSVLTPNEQSKHRYTCIVNTAGLQLWISIHAIKWPYPCIKARRQFLSSKRVFGSVGT